MLLLDLIADFHENIRFIVSEEMLRFAIKVVSEQVGFRYFSIMHHGAFTADYAPFLRIHNYPDDLIRFHDANGYGTDNPVHRLSERRGSGFLWSALPELLSPLTERDQRILDYAERLGVGQGYTRPFHIPGERTGSSSFALKTGLPFPRDRIAIAEALGAFAFEAARSLLQPEAATLLGPIHVTTRERDILILYGQGAIDVQIAHELQIGARTVGQHLKNARARNGIHKTRVLLTRALFERVITFEDIRSDRASRFYGNTATFKLGTK